MSFAENLEIFTGDQVNGDGGTAKSSYEAPNDALAIEITTEYLVVGTGPAGASLACFLGSNGLTGLVLSQYSSTADTPRAHITNMAALDCLRDIGLDEDCYKVGTSGDCMTHTRWMYSMAGEEYARIFSWGNDPLRKGEYDTASPSVPIDLPQTLLEPILMQYAATHGFKCRFDTKFLSFQEDKQRGTIISTVEDRITQQQYRIQSKYLFGADGARSRIVQQLELPLIHRPAVGWAVNVLVEADLNHIMKYRVGNLHWVLQPDNEHPEFARLASVRMIKPWTEWMVIMFPKPGAEKPRTPDEEAYLELAQNFIGDDSVDVKLLGISYWDINETIAETFSRGNTYCLGDAVHRHPPNHGLGSNTCIQDTFNLAWKVAYVAKGQAGKRLLDSYSIERQPVGQEVVKRTNASLVQHSFVWEALGVNEPTKEQREGCLAELKADSPAGKARRTRLQAALKGLEKEEHGLGLEMNQRYVSSAVYQSDQGPAPTFDSDPLLYYQPTTYPGARLPHAWLNKAIPTKLISTIDVAGKGEFTLFTGIGGEAWKAAATKVSNELGVPIRAYSIGFRQDYEDSYYAWEKFRGIEESGCVLTRPDVFVAWRCNKVEPSCDLRLRTVMRSILSLD